MRKFALYATIPYIIVVMGTIITFDNALGSLVRVAGLPVIACWILHLLRAREHRRLTAFHFLFLGFIAWNVVTCFWSVDQVTTALSIYRYLLLFGMTVILWDLYRTDKEVRIGYQALVLGGYLVSVTTLYNYFQGVTLDDYQGRYGGGGFNPNDIGKIVGITIPIAWYLAMVRKDGSKLMRRLNFLYPMVGIVAVTLSASRGGLVACIPGFLYILYTLRRLPVRVRLGFVGVAIIGMVGLVALHPEAQIQRLTDAFQSAGEDHMSGRTDIWESGLRVFQDNAFTGVGTGAYATATWDDSVDLKGLYAHNTFLSVLTETGAFGFLMFLGIVALVIRNLIQLRGEMRNLWITVFIAWVLAASTSSFELRAQTWITLVFILISAHIVPEVPVVRENRLQQDALPARAA